MAPIPMGQMPLTYAEKWPGKTALVCGDVALTWGELASSVARRAQGLHELGVGLGDFVTIALPNSAAFLETTYAALWLGATPQPISSKAPVHEVKGVLDLAKPKVVVGDLPAELSGWKSLPSSWAGARTDAVPPVQIAKYWKAMTSGGSTGRPKLIVDHNPGVVDLSVVSPIMSNGSGSECSHLPGPLYHNGPFSMSMTSLNRGRLTVNSPRFDPEETLKLIQTYKADWLYQVPTMMSRIWKLPLDVRAKYDVSSLKMVLHLAAPCPPWLKEAWIEWLGPDVVWELYGGTEGQGFTLISGREWLAHRGSVGRFVGEAKAKVVDPDGKELPPGQVGEVFILAPGGRGSTYHYLGADARAQGEWESLGDMGWLDAEGYLYLADRRTDLILRGGANIYPAEVEAVIDEHPAVASSVVIGLPHEDLGASVHAIVQLKAGHNPREAEAALRDFLRARIVSYKVPSSFEFVADFLRDDAGKVRRSALREERMKRG